MVDKSSDNSVLRERIFISNDAVLKYGIDIDIYSKQPLLIGYGEVTVINSEGSYENNTISGGLCFSIESYGTGEERFHSIYLCGALCTPRLSLFSTPFSQSFQRNSFSSSTVDNTTRRFFSDWSRSEEPAEISGKKDDLTLFISESQSKGTILQIKVFSEKDYYTVAAWFILVEANKHIKEEAKSPVFEMYWPDCKYYHKKEVFGDLNESFTEKNEQTIYFSSDADAELQKRESASPICFTGLLLSHLFGYYDEQGNPRFFSNANIVNVRYGDGVLLFDVVNSDTGKQIETARDFTFSPVLYIVKSNEPNCKVNYLGDISSDNEEHSSYTILKAETIDAPYMSVWPLFFECRLYKREGKYQLHYEASVIKTHISREISGDNEGLDINQLWARMTWEQTD